MGVRSIHNCNIMHLNNWNYFNLWLFLINSTCVFPWKTIHRSRFQYIDFSDSYIQCQKPFLIGHHNIYPDDLCNKKKKKNIFVFNGYFPIKGHERKTKWIIIILPGCSVLIPTEIAAFKAQITQNKTIIASKRIVIVECPEKNWNSNRM